MVITNKKLTTLLYVVYFSIVIYAYGCMIEKNLYTRSFKILVA